MEGITARSDFEDLKDQRQYYQKRREVGLESQEIDQRLQEAQLAQLRKASIDLKKNLDFARRNLERLNVRAPLAGQLTAFDLEIGQSLSTGQRIGQVDDPDRFKVVADIDEFYLGRVDIGQLAELHAGDQQYDLHISKIYPQVKNGQFMVDLVFKGEAPENIRRGQTLQISLRLGDPRKGLLIPNGAFFQDTGGSWIFVVSADGKLAMKREIRLGRRNPNTIEVLEGLKEGERVITSPYTNYLELNTLKIRP